MEFSDVQRRVREPCVLIALLASVALVAVVAVLMTLFLQLLWQLSAARPIAGALSKAVSSWDRLNRLHVQVLLIFVVTLKTAATTSATTPAMTAASSGMTLATPMHLSGNIRANQSHFNNKSNNNY